MSSTTTPYDATNGHPGATVPPVAPTAEIACNLTAIPVEHRDTHQALANYLLTEAAGAVQELADGYAIRFGADHYAAVVAFIAHERLCCPFFTFTLEVTPAAGPIWLRLTGPDGAKELLQGELGFSLPGVV
jgi:hypothetical protein